MQTRLTRQFVRLYNLDALSKFLDACRERERERERQHISLLNLRYAEYSDDGIIVHPARDL